MSNRPVLKSRSALISGASIAGPTLAFWLELYGFDVTLVERAAAVRSGGYPIDIRGRRSRSSNAWGCGLKSRPRTSPRAT